jgi:DNA-binding NtrC family response regulator
VRPVGSPRAMKVDVRVIAATHRDLERATREESFRQDLFYRLHVFAIRVPPLRERREDIPLLVAHFLASFAARGQALASLTAEALAALAAHEWPGNVRELENTLERLAVEARGGTIDVVDLPPAFRERRAPLEQPLFTGLPSLEELEKRYLRHVLAEVKGNRSRAAEVLGIDRRTLYRMAERFGIELKD